MRRDAGELSAHELRVLCEHGSLAQLWTLEFCGVCNDCEAKDNISRDCAACRRLSAKLGPDGARRLGRRLAEGAAPLLRALVLTGS